MLNFRSPSGPVVSVLPIVVLMAVAIPALFVGLGWAPLIDWDENIYAEVARQIVLRGEYLVLYLNGQPFWEKPPLYLWQLSAFFRMFGVSEAVARLPSAVNALVMVGALALAGRRLVNGTFGWLWALMYLTAFLPLLLARSAVIDYTFSALITAAVFLLIFYDHAHGEYHRRAGSAGKHWGLLCAAAVAMGLAVLTKGPLGGVVPLVAFASYKLALPQPRPRVVHVFACGVLSLAIAGSWYGYNYFTIGPEFLGRFAKFQGLLFSRPLEGHGGPVYYHLLVGLVGLFPWTPLLLLYLLRPVRRALWGEATTRALITCCLGWSGFVLVLFSVVQTKLPHYSSVMYVPLTFLAALALAEAVRVKIPISRWIGGLFGLYGLGVGVLFAVIPYFLAAIAEREGIALSEPPLTPDWAWLPGAVLALGSLIAGGMLLRRRLRPAVVVAAVAMGLFMPGVWRVHLPLFTAYNQGAVLSLMEEAYRGGGELVLYRTVSFAVLFYGRRDVEMLHTYKFPGDPALLDNRGARPVYIIAPKSEARRLEAEHPLVEPVRQEGRLALYRINPRQALPAAGGAKRLRSRSRAGSDRPDGGFESN